VVVVGRVNVVLPVILYTTSASKQAVQALSAKYAPVSVMAAAASTTAAAKAV
jgi:hypothetical protein